jgi:hypothetical protein
MLPVTDLLLLTLGLSALFAALGVLSLAFEQGMPMLARRPQRGRVALPYRTQRRVVCPRRRRRSAARPPFSRAWQVRPAKR